MLVKFYKKAVEDKAAQAGYPVFVEKDFCTIIKAGGQALEFEATEEFVQRKTNGRANMANEADPLGDREAEGFLRAWQNYKNNEAEAVNGLPVAEWGLIPRTEAETLKSLGIPTVEDLAEAPQRVSVRHSMPYSLRSREI